MTAPQATESIPEATESTSAPKIRENLPAPASAEGELFHYTLDEAALWLPFSVVKLRRMVHARQIPHVNNGNKIWFSGRNIAAISEQFTVPVLPESQRPAKAA